MRRVAVLLALLAVALALPPVGEAHYRLKNSHACKNDAGIGTDIRVRKMRCRNARKVIRKYLEGGDETPLGFTCRVRARVEGDSRGSQPHKDVRCGRRRKKLVFATG